jgi:hypothetical protein
MMMVHHHVKYKEIHGYDEVILMEKGEHDKLHKRLRKEGRCKISREDLHRISTLARQRSDDYKIYNPRNARIRRQKIKGILPRIRPDIIEAALL